MSEFDQIIYQKEPPIARVILNRPHYRNAQSRFLREEMDKAFDLAMDNDDVRVVILSGAGDHFSSGHDIGTPEEKADQQARPYSQGAAGNFERAWELNVENSLRWRDLPKPTIAEVQGYCIFGGWIIASAMDLIVASDDAKFIPGPVQYFTMPWDLGFRKAKEVLFQAKMLTAVEAHELGFVNQVVPLAQLKDRTTELALRIAETEPFVLRMLKRSINMTQDAMGFHTAVEACYSNYLHLQLGGFIGGKSNGQERLKLVDQALRADSRD